MVKILILEESVLGRVEVTDRKLQFYKSINLRLVICFHFPNFVYIFVKHKTRFLENFHYLFCEWKVS